MRDKRPKIFGLRFDVHFARGIQSLERNLSYES